MAVYLTTLLAFGAAMAQDSATSNAPNPADLTAPATHLEVMPEYDRADDYDAYIVRLNYDQDFAGGVFSFNVELPIGEVRFKDGRSETGIGDLRGRFFWKFYDKPGSALDAMVLNVDVFFPTGDADAGLGLGTTLLVPNLIFSLPVSDRWVIYPGVAYKFSTNKTVARSSPFPPGKNPLPGRIEEDYIRSFQIESYFTYMTDTGFWFFFDPIVEWDLTPEPDEENYEATLRSQIGKMWGRNGVAFDNTVHVAGDKSQDFQVRLMWLYYF